MEFFHREYTKRQTYYFSHDVVLRVTLQKCVLFLLRCLINTLSLNDLLMIRLRIQQDLYPILLRFIYFLVTVCAKVVKLCYVKVYCDDKNWRWIPWPNTQEDPERDGECHLNSISFYRKYATCFMFRIKSLISFRVPCYSK